MITTNDPPLRIGAEERDHPAVRRLARACIALVRWQRARETDSSADLHGAAAADEARAEERP